MAMVCMRGMSMPVEIAWNTRPVSSTPKLGANRSANAPTMNTCWRTEKRRERNVATGTVMPSTSM